MSAGSGQYCDCSNLCQWAGADQLICIRWSILWSRKVNLITGQGFFVFFFLPQGGLLIYNNQLHACCWQGHDTWTCVAHTWKALMSVHPLVLLSSLPPGGLDCPVPTVTPRPPLCGAETPRASLCAMRVDSTWSSMGCATYSASVYTPSVSSLYLVSA